MCDTVVYYNSRLVTVDRSYTRVYLVDEADESETLNASKSHGLITHLYHTCMYNVIPIQAYNIIAITTRWCYNDDVAYTQPRPEHRVVRLS